MAEAKRGLVKVQYLSVPTTYAESEWKDMYLLPHWYDGLTEYLKQHRFRGVRNEWRILLYGHSALAVRFHDDRVWDAKTGSFSA